MKKKNLQNFLCMLLGIMLLSTAAQAQELVNFEDTWQKFLKENKTSAVSELMKPEKSNTKDYLKYCLMYANSHFCADDLKASKEHMAEITKIGATQYDPIPGFKERFNDLTNKIAAYYKVDELWVRFLSSHDVSHAELNKIADGKNVCEKGTLAKYFYMSAYAFYCKGEVASAKTDFSDKVVRLTEKANLDPKKVAGLADEMKTMKEVLRVNDMLDPVWSQYISTDKSPGFPTDMPLISCYPIPNMKIYMLRAMVDICKYGSEMLAKIKELEAINTHTVPVELQNKIEWLEKEVTKYNGDITNLNKAWKEFVPTDKVASGTKFIGEYCEKDAQIKSYIMEGTIDPCNKGEEMLEKIEKVQKEFNPTLDNITKEKITKLQATVKKQNEGIAILKKAWEEFVPSDTLLGGAKFPFEYCDKEAQIQAYIMDGRIDACNKGERRLADVAKVRKEFNPELSSITQEKLEALEARVKQYQIDNAALDGLWKTFISNNDTIATPYTVAEFYCDKIMQVKSWCLMGHFNTCEQGQQYLDKINAFQKLHKLTFDAELTCRVTRLRLKIWDCRYWEMVRQAWKETHEERERFGPPSAEIMRKDLNGPKQVCETKVEYEPLGKIGIKYVIKIYLCQNVDLAQMGDPEYYKKIAKWIDTEVLTKYCAPDMRCKKDFFIYIEGHTDGNPFSYYKYKEPLNIPKGLPFTHFVGDATPAQKNLDRELTYELKSNMELGLGRAWTVKKQLDFVGVPITIGAYEHPAKEKGGEYRRMEVELNMSNLLLDYFEKRLKTLLDASGIGAQPANCKS